MQIGEVARLTGISSRMLRHYDSIGLVSPEERRDNGYRDYGPADIDRLFRVEGLKSLGLSLKEVGESLDDADLTATGLIDHLIEETSARVVRDRQLIERLQGIRDSPATSWNSILDVIALLRGLASADPARRQRVALTSANSAPVIELVDALLAETDLNVAGTLQWAVTRSVSDAAPYLCAALESPDQQICRRAIDAIVRLETADSLPLLREATAHRDQTIRDRAFLALGGHGDTEVVPHLIEMIMRGADDVHAAEVLGQFRSRSSIVAAIVDRLAIPDTIPGGRGRLTQALGEVPGLEARRALSELADDPDRVVSATARYLLTMPDNGV